MGYTAAGYSNNEFTICFSSTIASTQKCKTLACDHDVIIYTNLLVI